MSNQTAQSSNESLPFLTNQERMQAYQLLINGCSHIWGREENTFKRVFHTDKAKQVLDILIPLTEKDPYFLAHLNSYLIKNSNNKDLQIFTTFVNSLSKADGTAFSATSKYNKPNLRTVASAAVHMMDVKVASMLLELSLLKFSTPGYLNPGKHFSRSLRTAFEKYVKYIQSNPKRLTGIKEVGLAQKLIQIYRLLNLAPTDEAASILRWQQKDHKIELKETRFADFDELSDLEIAEKIRNENLPALGVLANLKKDITPVIAVAVLEQATGNQAVILGTMFEEMGILKDPEVMKLYEEKIKTATTALERMKAVTSASSQEVKQALNSSRAQHRQEQTQGLGKVYLHLDFSGSMSQVQQFASEKGAIFAECVNDPQNNFGWGAFGTQGLSLPLPQEFVKDAFEAVLFGVPGLGGTDCFQLYPTARNFGAEVDIFVSDQEQTAASIGSRIKKFHEQNPNLPKPKACVIIDYSNSRSKGDIQQAYEDNQIPVAVLKPDTLSDSVLVIEAVKTALQGPMKVIDDIMATELLQLPKYYFAI